MPELVERGHVYIAQPPLYKIKKGKQERYVKDDAEMERYLTEVALTNAALYPSESAAAIEGTALAALVEEYQTVNAIIGRLANHYYPAFLNELVYQSQIPAFTDKPSLTSWLAEIEARMNTGLPTGTRYDLSAEDTGESNAMVTISFSRHGISTDYHVPGEFFTSTEYNKILSFSNKINGLFGVGARMERGERKQEVSDFAAAVNWLMAEAKRGQHVQRYKGLGEMNPEQLWETTMDKSKRRLLQVKIEDAIAADETFNTLMGDNVEPRREFIETHALQVSNLDI
jgi:DNA gyrase subunit B